VRLSVWQQFSSNHSAHFTVIGVFENAEKTQTAAEELRSILKQIENWHHDNPEKAKALYDQWGAGEWPPSISEMEMQLAKQYNMDWKGGIDWYCQANISVVLNRLVVLEPQGQVDWGPWPFDRLMERLGGQGIVAGEDLGGNLFGEIDFLVVCDAPDEATADEIVAEKATDEFSVERFDLLLRFQWNYMAMGFYLPKLIAYLKSKRCTNIHYNFEGKTHIQTEFIAIPDDNKE
jgi:hypothetical protein